MPQAVETYVKTKNFEAVDRVKKWILTLYREDITKFARGYEVRILAVFDEMPSQLSKTGKNINCPASARGYDSGSMRMHLCGWRKQWW